MKTKIISSLLAVWLTASSLCSCTQSIPEKNIEKKQETVQESETEEKQETTQKRETEGKEETEVPHIHVFGEWITVKMACLSDGSKERSCACGEKEIQTVSMTGHKSEEGKCLYCGIDFFDELVTLIKKYGEKNGTDYTYKKIQEFLSTTVI